MLTLKSQPRSSFEAAGASAYIEMPDENTRHRRERDRVEAARLLVEPQLEVLGHRARPRAVVERHHEDADEDHRRDRADPVEVAGRDAVLGARGGHADHFLRAEVGREEREAGDPRGNRAAREEEVLARLHDSASAPSRCRARRRSRRPGSGSRPVRVECHPKASPWRPRPSPRVPGRPRVDRFSRAGLWRVVSAGGRAREVWPTTRSRGRRHVQSPSCSA